MDRADIQSCPPSPSPGIPRPERGRTRFPGFNEGSLKHKQALSEKHLTVHTWTSRRSDASHPGEAGGPTGAVLPRRRPPPRSASSAAPGPSSPPTGSPGSCGSLPTTGPIYRARTFTAIITSLASRHQRIRPYTPRHNGKVERYNRILAEECLYARSYSSQQQRRDAVAVWNHHYNYHRPHTTLGCVVFLGLGEFFFP